MFNILFILNVIMLNWWIHLFTYPYRVMWSACFLAAISSVTYPAISSFISIHSDADKQGSKYFKF